MAAVNRALIDVEKDEKTPRDEKGTWGHEMTAGYVTPVKGERNGGGGREGRGRGRPRGTGRPGRECGTRRFPITCSMADNRQPALNA